MARKKEKKLLLDNVIQADFTQTRYDYKLQSPTYILLLARDSRGNPGTGRAIQITPGFNFSTFLEMGSKGYLTGNAKKDYQEYMKGVDAGRADITAVFRDSGIGSALTYEKKSTTQEEGEEEDRGYGQDFC